MQPPSLPNAPSTYSSQYMSQLIGILRVFFNGLTSVQSISIAGALINLDTLPTEADVATLRVGTMYRDTTAGNVLKVKT